MANKKVIFAFALAISSLVATTGAEAQTRFVVRDFAHNSSTQDWALTSGWSWNNGVLMHGSGAGVARQATMSALTPGRLYRVDVSVSQRTQGSVIVSLGNEYDDWLAKDGSYSLWIWVNDPNQLLTFMPTTKFDGSISRIRVVELGDEIVPNTSGTPQRWSSDGRFFDGAGHPIQMLEQALSVVSGHVYIVAFKVARLAAGEPEQGEASVSVGVNQERFTRNGSYAVELEADASGHLVFADPRFGDPATRFNGALRSLSVREIVSDPVQAQTAAKN